MEINGKVVLITGGASGLGEACARLMVKNGAKVAILDLARETGEKVAADLGDSAAFYQTDVTDEVSVSSAVTQTIESFGGLHVAVNCAGVGVAAKVLGKDGPMSLGHFEKVVKINLIGTMNVIRLAAAQMVKNEPMTDGERGVIINTASVAAFDGQIGQAAYAASKAGVAGMTLPIAREFAYHGISRHDHRPGLV